eukprot:scaffold62_cov256-Pinguiococcus_pyrenoidosus.AAC.2
MAAGGSAIHLVVVHYRLVVSQLVAGVLEGFPTEPKGLAVVAHSDEADLVVIQERRMHCGQAAASPTDCLDDDVSLLIERGSELQGATAVGEGREKHFAIGVVLRRREFQRHAVPADDFLDDLPVVAHLLFAVLQHGRGGPSLDDGLEHEAEIAQKALLGVLESFLILLHGRQDDFWVRQQLRT